MPRLRIFAEVDPISGAWADGYEHRRDKSGYCLNCDAPSTYHYRLQAKPRDTPIYDRLVRAAIQAKS